jgi:hypothetical protein
MLLVFIVFQIAWGGTEPDKDSSMPSVLYPQQVFCWDAKGHDFLYLYEVEYKYFGNRTGEEFRKQQSSLVRIFNVENGQWGMKSVKYIDRVRVHPELYDRTILGLRLYPLAADVGADGYRWKIRREYIPITLDYVESETGGFRKGSSQLNPPYFLDVQANEVYELPWTTIEEQSLVEGVTVYSVPLVMTGKRSYFLRAYLIKDEKSMGKQMAAEGELYLNAFNEAMEKILAPYVDENGWYSTLIRDEAGQVKMVQKMISAEGVTEEGGKGHVSTREGGTH